MKIKLGKEYVEEYRICKFELHGNKLTMVNVITGTLHQFVDSKFEKIISNRFLPKVKQELKENNRAVK